MPNDKQIFELPDLTANILTSGLKISFIAQVENYDLDFQVPIEVLQASFNSNISGGFKGLVTALTYNPSSPKNGETWLVVLPGIYPNFSGVNLTKSIGIVTFNGAIWVLTQANIYGTGSNSSTSSTQQIPLPEKNANQLVQDGLDWYLDLSGDGLPDYPQLFVYIDVNGDGTDIQSVFPNYKPNSKRLYGFSKLADPNQIIRIFYNDTVAGGGTAPTGVVDYITFTDPTTPGRYIKWSGLPTASGDPSFDAEYTTDGTGAVPYILFTNPGSSQITKISGLPTPTGEASITADYQ